MAKYNKMTKSFRMFRHQHAKTLRESNPDFEKEMCDPPVRFYLISNIVANGSPISTLDEMLKVQAARQVNPSTVTIMEMNKESVKHSNVETGTSESILKSDTNTPTYRPIPMSYPIQQKVTLKETLHDIHKDSRTSESPKLSSLQQRSRVDLLARHGSLLQMTETDTRNSQRCVARNQNLLNAALYIIDEMDPACLEILYYAIHDLVNNNKW